MIKDLKARAKTIQFLEENASVSFGDLGIDSGFLDMAPKHKPPKNKERNWISQKFPISVLQIRSVTQSCPSLCDPMNRSTPGLPVHHQLPEFTQTQRPLSQ